MKAVLISIHPKWCELIASGKKTVEVRKTKPNLETPFKVYIYETQGRTETPFVDEEGHEIFKGRGQVIGEFVCKWVHKFRVFEDGAVQDWNFANLEKSCLTYDEIAEYVGREKYGYAWHVSDLVIYDNPKELSEFFHACDKPRQIDCSVCIDRRQNSCTVIKRPPQSWCYVEEMAVRNDGI